MRSKVVDGQKLQGSKDWSSETDLRRLPPLSPAVPISPRLSRKGIHGQLQSPRPPTPSPNRSPNLTKPRLAPLSPSSSSQRLSLNLDLITLKEEIVAMEGRTGSPQSPRDRVPICMTDSPRMHVRSLPSSPRGTRRFHASARRLNSDPENCLNHSKEDRIVEWIRDVQRLDDTVEHDDILEFSSTSDCSDQGSSPILPAIQENTVLNSHSS